MKKYKSVFKESKIEDFKSLASNMVHPDDRDILDSLVKNQQGNDLIEFLNLNREKIRDSIDKKKKVDWLRIDRKSQNKIMFDFIINNMSKEKGYKRFSEYNPKYHG